MGVGLGLVIFCLLLLLFGGSRDRTEEKSVYEEAENAVRKSKRGPRPNRRPWGDLD